MKGLIVEIYSNGNNNNVRSYILVPLTNRLCNIIRAHFQFFNLGSDFEVDEASSYCVHEFKFHDKDPSDDEFELIEFSSNITNIPNTELRLFSNQNGFWFKLTNFNDDTYQLSRTIPFKSWKF